MQQIINLPCIPRRDRQAHKGDFGRAFILAGSQGMAGAACLATQGCLRSGAGLVTLGVPYSLMPIVSCRLTCSMTKGLYETESQTLSEAALSEILDICDKMDVVAIGPGLGQHISTQNLVQKLVPQIKKPLVIDADGLNAIAKSKEVLLQRDFPTILTPHPGEFIRLCPDSANLFRSHHKHSTSGAENFAEHLPPLDTSRAENLNTQTDSQIFSQQLTVASQFAKQYNCIMVLKLAKTIVTDGYQYYVNLTGNPGMATGGSGDVLTGVITGLLAQKFDCFQAVQMGVWCHGYAGDFAARDFGEIGMIAEDLLLRLPQALHHLQNYS